MLRTPSPPAPNVPDGTKGTRVRRARPRVDWSVVLDNRRLTRAAVIRSVVSMRGLCRTAHRHRSRRPPQPVPGKTASVGPVSVCLHPRHSVSRDVWPASARRDSEAGSLPQDEGAKRRGEDMVVLRKEDTANMGCLYSQANYRWLAELGRRWRADVRHSLAGEQGAAHDRCRSVPFGCSALPACCPQRLPFCLKRRSRCAGFVRGRRTTAP